MRDFMFRIPFLDLALFKGRAVEETRKKRLFARDYSGGTPTATEK